MQNQPFEVHRSEQSAEYSIVNGQLGIFQTFSHLNLNGYIQLMRRSATACWGIGDLPVPVEGER